MKSFNSEVFGNVQAPQTFDEILSLALDPPKQSYWNVWMWRGQADIAWPIHSAAFRRLKNSKKSVTERDLMGYEKDLLLNATHKGFRRFEGTQLSDFDLLARLQHHGAATRLLDTTRSVLVALYFACDKLPDNWGALFGFHADYLGGGEGRPLLESYDEVVKRLDRHNHPQTWEPPNISNRVAAQHSQFLYSKLSNSERGSVCVDREDMLMTIAIEPELKEKCLRILSSSFDIRGLTLFPDLDGFGNFNSPNFAQYSNHRW